jgi:hypothetical protein
VAGDEPRAGGEHEQGVGARRVVPEESEIQSKER